MDSEKIKETFKNNFSHKRFEDEMNITFTDFITLPDDNRLIIMEKYNQKFTEKESSSSSDDFLDFAKSQYKIQNSVASPTKKNTKLLMPKDQIYYVNKMKKLEQHNIYSFHDMPENTIFELEQAEYKHVTNTFDKSSTEKKGVFLAQIRIIGQMLPAELNTPTSSLSELSTLNEPIKISKPEWVDSKYFRANILNQAAYIKTCFDKDEDPDRKAVPYHDFGAQKLKKNEKRNLQMGRYARNPMPIKFLVYGNASIEKMIFATNPKMTAPVIFYRETKTDPMHPHNKHNCNPLINFAQMGIENLVKAGVLSFENKSLVQHCYFDNSSLIANKGKQEFIGKIVELLKILNQISENDLENNITKGISLGTKGSDFRINLPDFLSLRGKKKLKRKEDNGSNNEEVRDRSPLRKKVVTVNDEDEDDDDDEGHYNIDDEE